MEKRFRYLCALYSILISVSLLLVANGCKKPPPTNPPINPPSNKKWVVTTFAGDGTKNFADGPLLSAKFSFPEDVAIAPDGSIYVTDVINHRIRKILSGQVTTFAGNSSTGIINGNGTAAQFISPFSLTIDTHGNLYSTDDNDPRIRRISPVADAVTHAGTAATGFAEGDAMIARFGTGNYIVSDAEGNIYVADAINNRIRKVSINGQVSTIAGSGVSGFEDGSGSSVKFSSPAGIIIDRTGNLFVADRGNHRIRKITPAGQVSTLAGNGISGYVDGDAGTAQFSFDMRDLVIDTDGNLYLSDQDRIRKITPQGVVSTIAGSTTGFANGEGLSAKFNYPNGLGIDADGNIFVADLNNNRIRKISFE